MLGQPRPYLGQVLTRALRCCALTSWCTADARPTTGGDVRSQSVTQPGGVLFVQVDLLLLGVHLEGNGLHRLGAIEVIHEPHLDMLRHWDHSNRWKSATELTCKSQAGILRVTLTGMQLATHYDAR